MIEREKAHTTQTLHETHTHKHTNETQTRVAPEQERGRGVRHTVGEEKNAQKKWQLQKPVEVWLGHVASCCSLCATVSTGS